MSSATRIGNVRKEVVFAASSIPSEPSGDFVLARITAASLLDKGAQSDQVALDSTQYRFGQVRHLLRRRRSRIRNSLPPDRSQQAREVERETFVTSGKDDLAVGWGRCSTATCSNGRQGLHLTRASKQKHESYLRSRHGQC